MRSAIDPASGSEPKSGDMLSRKLHPVNTKIKSTVTTTFTRGIVVTIKHSFTRQQLESAKFSITYVDKNTKVIAEILNVC
jgi:hypothetical protein